MKTIHLLVAAFCLLGFTAFAQEEANPFAEPDGSEVMENPRLVRTQVEFVEISHKDLTRLMMEDKNPTADATALRMKVQAMVDKDEAKIIDTQIVLGRSGQKQTTESKHEFIYPTKYEPTSKKAEEKTEIQSSGVCTNSAMPTAFEWKNLGSALETEPLITEDGRIVELRFLPEFTWHTGDTLWSERKDQLGNVYKLTMPDFYHLSIYTAITCISGQYAMAGVVSPKDANGEVDTERKVMVFVKCDVLEVK